MNEHPKKRHQIAMALVLTAFSHPIVYAAPPRVGDQAPALDLEKLLQAPAGAKADWEALRGKVVVLEFWATWCAPCVRAIPFLNKLEDSFRGKPVQFISITDEPEAVVRKFLKKKSIHSWIGLDTDGSVFKAFDIRGRPRAVVVDRNGKLVGWTDPSVLINKPDILDDLLAGKPRKLGNSRDAEAATKALELKLNQAIENPDGIEGHPPICLISIRPSMGKEPTPLGNTDRKFVYNAATLRSAIEGIYHVGSTRIVSAFPLSENQKYDIMFSWPKGDLRLGRALLQEAVEATFDLNIHREKRVMDVYVLTVPDGSTPSLEQGPLGARYNPETRHIAPTQEILERMDAGEPFLMTVGYLKTFTESLSFALNLPVVDETHIEGHYWFYFPYDLEKPDVPFLIKTVEQKYGLKLTPARRKIEVLVVETR